MWVKIAIPYKFVIMGIYLLDDGFYIIPFEGDNLEMFLLFKKSRLKNKAPHKVLVFGSRLRGYDIPPSPI